MRKKQMVPLKDVIEVVKYVFACQLSILSDKPTKKALNQLKKEVINSLNVLKYKDE